MSTKGNSERRPDADSHCCCNEQSDAAHVTEAGLQSFPASDPPDWNLGRDSEAGNCAGDAGLSPPHSCCSDEPAQIGHP